MTPEHHIEFAKCLYLLGETFNEPVSDLRVEAYWLALKDLPLEAVQAATAAALKSCTFFPKPAELRKLVEGSAEDKAEMAWLEAITEVRRTGSYGLPTWSDPAIGQAIRALGGWRNFCLTEDPLTYQAAQFKKAYMAVSRRAEIDRLLPAGATVAGLLTTEGNGWTRLGSGEDQ